MTVSPLEVDIHSHLLPGIDDGVDSLEESVDILRCMSELGYRKVITTPHIMGDFYPNTPEIINAKLEEVRLAIQKEGINIKIDAAAEYYMDEIFIEKLEKDEPLLTFGGKYLLFETSYINEPAFLRDGIFKISSLGLIPVMAHPERYVYVHNNPDILQDLYDRDVLYQMNINSLSGYYSKPAKRVAQMLVENRIISFVGSDCHGKRHLETLKNAVSSKYFGKVHESGLLNNLL